MVGGFSTAGRKTVIQAYAYLPTFWNIENINKTNMYSKQTKLLRSNTPKLLKNRKIHI
jgi:hypothetical protein